jgi:hypothetical protein
MSSFSSMPGCRRLARHSVPTASPGRPTPRGSSCRGRRRGQARQGSTVSAISVIGGKPVRRWVALGPKPPIVAHPGDILVAAVGNRRTPSSSRRTRQSTGTCGCSDFLTLTMDLDWFACLP